MRAPAVGLFVLLAFSCNEREPAPERNPPTASPSAAVLEVGDRAPDFTLPGSDGRTYTLSSFRGRQPVVLAWFAKAFTDG